MRISATRTQAIRRTYSSRLTKCFCLGTLLCVIGVSASAAERDSSWSDSLVKISLKYETSGIFHEGKYLSQSRVIEHTEFEGVIVDARGYILSYMGSHWLKMGSPQSRLLVEFSDGKSAPAQLVGVDERIDVAVVESPRAANREVGLGSSLDQKQLSIAGVADGIWRQLSICPIGLNSSELLPEKTITARICQSDPQTPSESGGLVLDRKGRFLGIVTEVEKPGVSKTLRTYRVVPTDILNESLRKLVDTRENLRAGYLGIYPDTEGKKVVVAKVEHTTPASDAGLLEGDVVVAVDSRPIQNPMEFGRILRWKGPGRRCELTVEREGGTVKISPVLTAYPERRLVYGWKLELPRVWDDDSKAQELKLSPMPLPSHLRFGLVVDTISPQLASYFKVPNGSGLLVTTVLEESLASRSGFQAGDVLIEINGTKLSSPSVMRELLYAGKDGVMVVRFVRDGVIQSRKLVFP